MTQMAVKEHLKGYIIFGGKVRLEIHLFTTEDRSNLRHLWKSPPFGVIFIRVFCMTFSKPTKQVHLTFLSVSPRQLQSKRTLPPCPGGGGDPAYERSGDARRKF